MFRTTVGQLIWASLDRTRPDVLVQNYILRDYRGPTERDLRSLKHTLRLLEGYNSLQALHWQGSSQTTYLPTTMVLFPSRRTTFLWTYVVSQIRIGQETKTTRRSTSGWLCSLLGTPLSYASRTQQTVTLSSAEAELMALSSGMAESLHVQQLLEELQTGMCTTTFSYNNPNKKCITLLH